MGQVDTAGLNIMAITRDEREFFIELGRRIATLRKDAHITQVQLAQTLGVAQSTLNAYELGQRRVPVSALPILAKSLGVSLEELIGEAPRPGKRGPTPKLQQQMERINQLPKAKQKFVIEMLEGVLSAYSDDRDHRF